MIVHRVADNRLGPLKDDLLLTLRRIQLDLDTYHENPSDLAPLEAIIEALGEMRGPLAALDHREAVALLEEISEIIQERAAGQNQPSDPVLLRQAIEQLMDYLAVCLAPGGRRPGAELTKIKETLRGARQQSALPATDTPPRALRDALKQLQQTLIVKVEGASEQPEVWEALRHDLRALEDLLAQWNRPRTTLALSRLERIVEVLAAGAAEHYGLLVSGVCAEILTELGHGLELGPADGEGSAAAALNPAEEHLIQMETLLQLPPLAAQPVVTPVPLLPPTGSPPAPTVEVAHAVSAPPDAISSLTFELAEWSTQAMPTPPEPVPTWADESSAIEPQQEQLAPSPGEVAPPMALSPIPQVEPSEVEAEDNPAASAAIDLDHLAALIGLKGSDPEFIEVFLEEACGELAAIREQLAVWRTYPDDHQALTALRRSFHTLKGSGRMVGATVVGDFAWEFENLLNQVLSGARRPDPAIAAVIAAAVEALAPLVGEVPVSGGELAALPPLVARAQALLRAEPEPVGLVSSLVNILGIDPEFVEVFLEEAREELAAIREQLALWRRNPADRQALTTLRRSFHTLKGSGRVVGAAALGDFAWRFENLLNQILNGALAATPAVADLVGETVTVLEPLIGEAPAPSADAIAALSRLAERADVLLQEPLVEAAPAPVESVPGEMAPPVEAGLAVEPAPVPEPLTPPAVEPELARVFQYEAAEILDASDVILQRLSIEPDRLELLNDLRRGMHTLKGSSRMAGIMPVGDLAHAAESVLDVLSKSGERPTPIVFETLQHALDRLNRMLADAADGTSLLPAADLIAELRRLTDAVAAGGVTEELPAALVAIPEEAAVVPEPRSLRPMTELDQELARMFQTEAAEVLDSSDLILRRLRGEPDNAELLNNLRREMHTLKGGSRMAGVMPVGDLAHAAESVLDALGKGAARLSPPVLDTLQRTLDSLHRMLAEVVRGAQPTLPSELIEELQEALRGEPTEQPQPTPAPVAAPAAPAAAPRVVPVAAPPRPVEKLAATPADSIRVSAALLNTLVNQMGESSIFRARVDQGVGAMSFSLTELEQTISRLRRQVTNLSTQAEARIQSRQDQGAKAHQMEFDPLELDRFTELQQVTRSLMEIADDLGNIGNTLSEHTQEVATLLDQQAKVNKEIQQGLMHTGMVRFGSIIPRLRRVVRQAAQELGKRAELLVGGEESEVDRTVLENMVAPLEHMLRNSLAHGIEPPERRRAAGKSEIGTITLSLRREGAELVLELGDDGSGLNFEAIRAKGEEKGLLLPDQPATQEELIALLLRPGFSTAATVTQISGRGVGMDVVNEAIRTMRGALLIQTERGQGTRFIVRLPFSLSVTQALLARAGDNLFAIPLLSIELVTRLLEKDFRSYLAGEQVQHQYSGRSYPIHNLGVLIGSEQILPFEEVADRRPPALLFRSAEASAALQVEAVLGNQEIIVKPVGPQFSGVPGISGATVLGDGRVVVVLELAALVRHIGSQAQKQTESRALRAARQEARPEKLSVMVIDDSITMRKVTARILERHNMHVITARDGLDAVALLQTQAPDLAILDIEMPRMDGFEVLAHVRNQPALTHLPIIMVTSRGGDKHRDRAMKLGVNDYLTKPYQEEQLMQAIRKILGPHALELIT